MWYRSAPWINRRDPAAATLEHLLDHRDRTITEGYQKLSMDHLRDELERVTAFLLAKARMAGAVPEGGIEVA